MSFLDFLRGLKSQSGGVWAKTPADLRAYLLDVSRSTAPFVVRDGSPEKMDLVVEMAHRRSLLVRGVLAVGPEEDLQDLDAFGCRQA
jgi:hypothetical protein